MTTFHLGADKRATLDEAAALVAPGATVALGGGLCARLPMALVRALVRAGRAGTAPRRVGALDRRRPAHRGRRGGRVRGELRRVRAGPRAGAGVPAGGRGRHIEVRESCCVTVLSQLRAAEMGLPFLPVRGHQGHRHGGAAPRVPAGDLPVHRRRAGRGAAAGARRRPAARPARRRGRQPAPGPALRARRAVRARVARRRGHRGPSGADVRGGRGGGDRPGAHASPRWSRRRSGRTRRPATRGTATTARTWPAYVAAAAAGGDRLAGYLDRYVHVGEEAYRAEIDTDRITSWSTSDEAWQELFR